MVTTVLTRGWKCRELGRFLLSEQRVQSSNQSKKKWNTQQISWTDFRAEEGCRLRWSNVGGGEWERLQVHWRKSRHDKLSLFYLYNNSFIKINLIFCCCNNWVISERSVFDPVFILITFSFQFNSIEVYLYSTNSQQKPPQGDFYCRVKTQQ